MLKRVKDHNDVQIDKGNHHSTNKRGNDLCNEYQNISIAPTVVFSSPLKNRSKGCIRTSRHAQSSDLLKESGDRLRLLTQYKTTHK